MKIINLELTNFRSKEHLNIQLGSKVTLLIGKNGSGKTAVLDAAAIGLGAALTYLPMGTGISFKKTDIRQKNNNIALYTRISLHTSDGVKWDKTARRDKSVKTTSEIPPAVGLYRLKKYLDETVINPFNEKRPFQLPVYSYYGVSRALIEVPYRRRGFPKSHERFEALQNALNAVSRFKSAFIWFYNKEFEEQKKQKEFRNFDYSLPELTAVRNAIKRIFPEISEPHIMLNPLRFAVKKEGEVLDIMQLSDGYKTLLSLVIDLASRMALANPDLPDPLKSPAIVMIDEIDLHLHPEWQRRVISDLLKVFSNTQFILTTHSPIIIESLNNHLQRFKISNIPFDEKEIKEIYSLSPEEVTAYLITDKDLINLMDSNVQLLNNQLIDPFNQLSVIYDKMRDIHWENKTYD